MECTEVRALTSLLTEVSRDVVRGFSDSIGFAVCGAPDMKVKTEISLESIRSI